MEAATTHPGIEKIRRYAHSSTRLSSILTVFTLTAIFPGCSFASPLASVAVRVFDYAQVPPATLASAEREANRILASAGPQVVWLDCLEKAQVVRSKTVCEAGWSSELLPCVCYPGR